MHARPFATLGIAAVLSASVTALPAVASPAQAAGISWGAIAWKYNGRSGGAYGGRTAGEAIREAKRRCGADCGYFTFYNSCGAVAYRFTYGRNEVGTAKGYPTHASARRAAARQLTGGIASRPPNSVCSF